MKVIRFNPLREDEMSFDIIESSMKVVDEFYISTEKGPIMAGEIWKDTPGNRLVIDEVIKAKAVLKIQKDAFSKFAYLSLNKKEK